MKSENDNNDKDKKNHIILGGIREHQIRNKKTGKIIFTEKSLGTDSEIPYFIIPSKEDDETVQEITYRLEKEQRAVTQQPLEITVFGKRIRSATCFTARPDSIHAGVMKREDD